MISNPRYGWCEFKLGSFIGTPSYLTDVPVDILVAFMNLHRHGSGVVFFDEEGTEFTLVVNRNSLFIIEEKEQPVLHDFSEVDIGDLEKELVEDIERDLDEWAAFLPQYESREIKAHRDEITDLLNSLKSIIQVRGKNEVRTKE